MSKFGEFVNKMVTKAEKKGTRTGPYEVTEKAKLAEVGRMKKAELEKIIEGDPRSEYYMPALKELTRREDVRTGKEKKGVYAMGREKAASTKDIREAADRSVEEKKMLGYAKGGVVKKFKPCAGCPSPAKCKAAGKCLMKENKKAKGGAVKGPSIMVAIAIPKAKKGKK